MISAIILFALAATMLVSAWLSRGSPKEPPFGWDCFIAEFDSTTSVSTGEDDVLRYRFWITESDGTRRLVGAVLGSWPDFHLGQSVRIAVSPGRDDLRIVEGNRLSGQQLALIAGAIVCVILAVVRVSM